MFGHHQKDAEVIEAEIEVRNVLFVLVQALDPHYVIETGCYHGTTTEVLASGMCNGRIDTMDVDIYSVEEARRKTKEMRVTVYHCSSLDFYPKEPIDFAFLDSGIGDMRLNELEHFGPYFTKNAIVAIHDSKQLWFEWPKFNGWRWININTRNGLLLLQKEG